MIGIRKRIIQWWVQIRWKSAKKFTQNGYRPKMFALSNKSPKLHFSVTFSWYFFAGISCNFFNRFEISIKFFLFYTDIVFLRIFFYPSRTFSNFECKRGRNGSKKTEKLFYIRVLELNFCNNQWPGRTKLLKPLHPTVHLPFLIKFAIPFVAFRARILISQEYLFIKNFIPSCILFIFQPATILPKCNQLYCRCICSAPCKI